MPYPPKMLPDKIHLKRGLCFQAETFLYFFFFFVLLLFQVDDAMRYYYYRVRCATQPKRRARTTFDEYACARWRVCPASRNNTVLGVSFRNYIRRPIVHNIIIHGIIQFIEEVNFRLYTEITSYVLFVPFRNHRHEASLPKYGSEYDVFVVRCTMFTVQVHTHTQLLFVSDGRFEISDNPDYKDMTLSLSLSLALFHSRALPFIRRPLLLTCQVYYRFSLSRSSTECMLFYSKNFNFILFCALWNLQSLISCAVRRVLTGEVHLLCTYCCLDPTFSSFI